MKGAFIVVEVLENLEDLCLTSFELWYFRFGESVMETESDCSKLSSPL